MDTLIGHYIGRYHILEKLGEGGMAVVYKAYDTHLDCEVALKVIQTDQILPAALERTRKRFEREAKDVARLVHPNIVKVMDYGEEGDIPYLVMPLLAGGTLSQKISAHGRLDWREAANLLIPIADALEYAHNHHIIHRDVKPSNILFTSNGTPMLADFGVAKILDEEGTLDLTGTNATVGTPDYMAPEQINSKTVDKRADIYSLGVVYYEMVTGNRPFSGVTPLETLFKHASEPLTRPTKLNPELPQDVEDFLIKSLMKKPEHRFSSMAEMENALRSLVNGQPLNLQYYPPPLETTESLATVDQDYDTVDEFETTDQDAQAKPFDHRKTPPPFIHKLPEAAPPKKKTNSLWFILGGIIVVGVVMIILTSSIGGSSTKVGTTGQFISDTDPVSEGVSSTEDPFAEQVNMNSAQLGADSPKQTSSTPTAKQIPTITPTEFKCPGMPVSQVKVGDKVVVCSLERLILREEPAIDGTNIRAFEPGTKGEIFDGPVCEDDSTWWKVRINFKENIYEGWMREGTDPKAKYFLCVDHEN
ncbi:MAG TPA: serine/threonine protein kinase [Anaerolineaceae bacterium]|nr:serine/threonine protein kinase [Anaerolineaceae bacterium]